MVEMGTLLLAQLRAWAASSKHRASIPAEIDDVNGLLDSLERMFVGLKLTVWPVSGAPQLKVKLSSAPEADPLPEDGTVLKVCFKRIVLDLMSTN